MRFQDLSLIPELLEAISQEGYSTPTPIQAQAIPPILQGRDLLGLAQTGTGKTAAFSLPLLQRLSESDKRGRPRALIVTPTRELASQIGESIAHYGRHLHLSHAVIFGGVNAKPQIATLKQGVDILVATPGRLLDHMGSGLINFKNLEFFVLDEADRMLDMGFAPMVKRIIRSLPPKRQSLFFSATMPAEVQSLAGSLLRDPVQVAVTPPATTAERIEQVVYHVPAADKRRLLVSLLAEGDLSRVLVFTRTKHGANRLVDYLKRYGTEAAVIHGNKSQSAREKALAGFKAGHVRVLVATDIAARGIDVDQVSHVINYELPNLPESYVHRIGRTARAGHDGHAIAFCAPDEKEFLRDIEKATRQRIPVRELPVLPNEDGQADLERGAKPELNRYQREDEERRNRREKRPRTREAKPPREAKPVFVEVEPGKPREPEVLRRTSASDGEPSEAQLRSAARSEARAAERKDIRREVSRPDSRNRGPRRGGEGMRHEGGRGEGRQEGQGRSERRDSRSEGPRSEHREAPRSEGPRFERQSPRSDAPRGDRREQTRSEAPRFERARSNDRSQGGYRSEGPRPERTTSAPREERRDHGASESRSRPQSSPAGAPRTGLGETLSGRNFRSRN